MAMFAFNVTKHRIKCGVRHNETKCPIALALSGVVKSLKPGLWLEVYYDNICVYKKSATTWMPTQMASVPHEYGHFVCDFDHGETVKPFKGTIVVPDRLLKE